MDKTDKMERIVSEHQLNYYYLIDDGIDYHIGVVGLDKQNKRVIAQMFPLGDSFEKWTAAIIKLYNDKKIITTKEFKDLVDQFIEKKDGTN